MPIESGTFQFTPKSGGRGGCDRSIRRTGSKVYTAVDPMGHPVMLKVTATNEGGRVLVADGHGGNR